MGCGETLILCAVAREREKVPPHGNKKWANMRYGDLQVTAIILGEEGEKRTFFAYRHSEPGMTTVFPRTLDGQETDVSWKRARH